MSFTVYARDNGDQPRNTSATVTVDILDENDHAPAFVIAYPPITIREDQPVGTQIGVVSATDADQPGTPNQQVRYSIVGGTGLGVFEVNPGSGAITVAQELNFENVSRYDLVVVASDMGSPSLNTSTTLIINIRDNDDHDPLFTEFSYMFMIRENNLVPQLVGRVVAVDVDPLNRSIGYNFSSDADPGLPFSINTTTGEIYAVQRLNRESPDIINDPEYMFTVVTFYLDLPESITDRATVIIEVLDENEVEVYIDMVYLDTVTENIESGQRIGNITAIDLDPDSVLEYFLTVSGDVLRVDNATGDIYINGAIDRESPTLFPPGNNACPPNFPRSSSCIPVFVRVVDQTTGQTDADLSYLFVLDIDDEPPVLSRQLYTVNVSENIDVGEPLTGLNIQATDPDFNISLSYFIPPSQGVTDFMIQPFSGLILVSQPIDYETTRQYRFTIIVEDSNGNQDNATVEVYILDENDNRPVFDQDDYNATIPESYPIRDVVAIVNAMDDDSTSNGMVTHTISAGNEDGQFSIDPITGAVSLEQSLDRESATNYTLTIEASDAGTPIQLTSTATLSITVGDVLDHPPQFLQSQYTGFVNESARIGAPVFDSDGNPLITTFVDLDIDDMVTVISFTFGNPIMINSMTGAVTVANPLDFEQDTVYRIPMVLRDSVGLYSAPATVTVNVLPINDHAPEFDRDEYTVSVEENSRQDEIILQAVAVDLDGSDRVSYSLVSDFNSSEVVAQEPGSAELQASGYSEEEITFPFEINNQTGEITLLRTLNYEVLPEWVFTIEARDRGGRLDTATVEIVVEDLNDNAPRFTEHVFEVMLLENTTVSRRVPAFSGITATDLDSVSQGRLQYFILGGDNGFFDLNRNNGDLYLVDGPLDPTEVYTFQIHVTDGLLTDAAVVRVSVRDINNNAPMFLQQTYSASIPENSSNGTFVVQVEATDNDQSVFANIMYGLVSSEYSNLFYIDENTGDIYTNSTGYDFDTPPSVYNLQVEALDGANQPRRAYTNVTITLQDINDNRPVFDSNVFAVTIPEDTSIGTSILRVTATDADSDINAEVFFHFPVTEEREEEEEEDMFSGSGLGSGMNITNMIMPLEEEERDGYMFILEPETGILRLNSTLDFDDPEAANPIILEILVTDRGDPPFTSNATIEITVSDSNDNDPYFNSTLIRELVAEDSEVGDVAFTVQAYDRDSGLNQLLTYDILSVYPPDCNDRFTIIPNGTVFLSELVDAEARGEPCTLVIQATDSGTPPRSGQATFVVIVTNINEHRPVISPESLSGSVFENSPNGTFVLQIMTSDRDGNNVRIIAQGEAAQLFDVSENGTVTVADSATLDREIVNRYFLMVMAVDDGLPELTSPATTITISILDENDNPPIFDQLLYNVAVREDHPLSVPPIVIVQARDGDIGSNADLSYSFVSTDEGETDYDTFAIHTSNGSIYLTTSLDYETGPRFYDLRVEVSDGEFKALTNVSIMVLETNDITPSFTNLPSVVQIPESLENGSLVYTANAEDMDQGAKNGRISYSLQGSDKFTIDPVSGEIFVNGNNQFDFDAGQLSYILNVTATDRASSMNASVDEAEIGEAPFLDQPRNMTAQLIVQITDVNDIAPRFTQEGYTALIVEHDQVPLLVSSVLAFDGDERETNNSRVRYRIVGGDFGHFGIDKVTGVIMSIPPIDREAPELRDGPSYELAVEAYDLGVPSLSSRVIVTVTVIDTNDERPVFTVPVFSGSVDENSPRGTSVLTVSAIDPDNFVAPLNYSLFETAGYFSIDVLTGVIYTTSQNLDREELQNITLRAQAMDQDGFVADADVIITINDVNDEAPVFGEPSYAFTIDENVYRSTMIGRVTTSDQDSPANAITEYIVLSEENGFFHVDPLVGVIRATGPICFDHAEMVVYSFDLVARDYQNNNLNNTVPVTVTVVEQNRYPPVFVRPSYISRLDEGALAGTAVLEELQTTDRDGCSGPPIFEIVDGNTNDTFEIDSDTGRIILTRDLLPEDLGFTLTLRATDTGNFKSPNRASQVTLIVLVGQLLPVSISVDGGFTVPAISRFSQEEYQQDVWLFNGGSQVAPDPVIRYSLGNIVAEQSIASNGTQATSVVGAIVQSEVYRDDPYVRVGLQVGGEGNDKVSVLPTEVSVLVSLDSFDVTTSCITQPPSATCTAEAQVPLSQFTATSSVQVFYGLSSDSDFTYAGNVSIVSTEEFALCPTPSTPYVRVTLPHLVLYPGDFYNINIATQTTTAVDTFHFTCTASEGLEFVEITNAPDYYIISAATSDNYLTVSGLRNQNRAGSTQFELDARMYLESTAEIVSNVLNISCTVDYLINVNNVADLYNSPAVHNDYASCSSDVGTVLSSPNTVVALFPFPRDASLLNTAVLNGRRVNGMLNIFGLTKSGNMTRDIPQLTCESSDSTVLKVEPDCSQVYLNGNETAGATNVNIRATSPAASVVMPFSVWYPTAPILTPDVIELSPIRGLYINSNGSCRQAYEYINLNIQAAFILGSVRQPVSIVPLVGDLVESSDETVLRVEFDTDSIRLVGVSAGQAQVQLTDSFGRVYTSPNITVTETTVSVEDLSLSLYSSLTPAVSPPSIPGTPYLETALVALNADLEHINVRLEVIPEAVLSNSRNYQLSTANGLVLTSNEPETIVVTDDLQVAVRGSGTGQILQGRVDSSCPRSESPSTTEFVDITVNPVASVEVTLTGPTILALRDESTLLNTPFQSYYYVELVHQDGTRVNVTTDSRLQFETVFELNFMDNGVIDVSNISSAGQVNFTISYTYSGVRVVSSPVYLEVVGIEAISLAASPYPYYSQWPMEGDLVLEVYSNTSLYQQAQLNVTAALSNGSYVDVSSSAFTQYENRGDVTIGIQGNIIEPFTSGNATIYAYVGSRFNDSIELQVSDTEVYAEAIVSFSIPNLTAGVLRTISEAVLYPTVAVRFSDGTYHPSFIGFEGYSVPNTIELTSSEPTVIEVYENGEIEVQRNSPQSVTLTASIVNTTVSRSRSFTVDILTQLGDIDVVVAQSLPFEIGETITVDLIANVEGYALGAAELIAYYDSNSQELRSISAGSDLPDDYVLSQEYGDTPGSIRFGAIFPSSVNGTANSHIFTLEFSVIRQINTVPEFNIVVMTLVENEEPYSTIGEPTPRISFPASFGPEPNLPELPNATIPCTSPPCSLSQCIALNGFVQAGDANGDCIFSLADALYTNAVLTMLNLPGVDSLLLPHQLNAIDANKNGIYDPADILFLIEARMGRFPLIKDLSLVPVESEGSDCVLTINVTLQDWDGDLNDQAFVYFGIFHPDPLFQAEYDTTSLSSGEKLSIVPPSDHSGGWISAEHHGGGTYGIQTTPGNVSKTDIGFTLVYGTYDTAGQPTNERTQFLFGQPSTSSAYSSLSASFTPMVGSPPVSVLRSSVNPLVFFNNNITAERCYNFFPPVISPDLPLLITSASESFEIGRILRTVTATDGDAPREAGNVRFSLENINPPGAIDIDEETGRIFVASTLDREESDRVTATIVATDQGPHIPTRMRDTLDLRVNILDVNDNPPVTDELVYFVRVLESSSTGSAAPILQIAGNDSDVDRPNNQISSIRVTEAGSGQAVSSTFGAIAAENSGGDFNIHLYLIRPLDRETLDTYNLTLTIFDRGNPSLSSTVEVFLQVIDANDLRPVFTSPSRVTINENNKVGDSFLTVTAVDNDIGTNALFNFTLNSVFLADDFGNQDPNALPLIGYFILDPVTDQLIANRTFDREGEHSFLINIIAQEEGIDILVSAVQIIWVMICDENDERPEFELDTFYANVTENSEEGTTVTIVNASDADLGPFCPSNNRSAGNNIVMYELLTVDVPFLIVAETGAILVNGSLDFESSEVTYNLSILAYDLGDRSLSSTTNLIIDVTDLNDNAPILSSDLYENVAVENYTAGTVVIDFIDAADKDSGVNQIINFELQGPGREDFSIDPFTGVISVAGTLDRERQPVYNLTVVAFNLDKSLNDTADIRIVIIDINDTPPVFNATQYFAEVSENLPIGGVALRVFATDADENRVIRYRLSESSNTFDVNDMTGEIFTLASLCTPQNTTHTLTVVAVDRPGGRLMLTSNVSVTISVYDDNRFPPDFTRLHYAGIVEDGVETNVPVLTVQATDADICSPPLSYSIVDNTPFSIDAVTGTIFTAASLSSTNGPGPTVYFFSVQAMDSGTDNPLSGRASIIVVVGETVPVEFTTDVGFKVAEASIVANNNSDVDVYEQMFDFFYDYDPLERNPTVQVDARFGDRILTEDIELDKLPATRVNAVLLTPVIPFDNRIVQVAMVAVDQYGSNRVDETTLFLNTTVDIGGQIFTVGTTQQTGPSSAAIVNLMLPLEWFTEARNVTISYGVAGSSPLSADLTASLIPAPNYDEICTNVAAPFLLVRAPSYNLYVNQVADIFVIAYGTTEYTPSSVALQCTVGSGLRFSDVPVMAQDGWAFAYELSPSMSQLKFTASRLTNVTSSPYLDYVAQMSITVLTNSISSATIDCITLDAVDNEGNFERFSEAVMAVGSECRPNSGQVTISPDILVGALPVNMQTIVINDAVLSGTRKAYFPSVDGVILSAPPRFTSILVNGLSLGTFSCSSTDDTVLKVDSNCRQVYIDGNEDGGAETVYINVDATDVTGGFSFDRSVFPIQLEYHVWYPELPLAEFTASDTFLSPISGWMTLTNNSTCVQEFQRANIYATAVFRLGSSSVSLRVENLLDITSSNPGVVRVNNAMIYGVGVSSGQFQSTATITAVNNRLSRSITNPLEIIVNTSPQYAVEFDAIYATNFSLSLPEELPYTGAEPFSASLDPNLSYETQTASLVSTVVFSDGTRLQLSADDGLSYAALNASVVKVAGSTLTAVSSGSGEILQVTWSTCGNSVVLSQNRELDIALLMPEVTINVPAEGVFLVHSSDPAASLTNIPTSVSLTVELVSRIGTNILNTVDVTAQDDTAYTFSPEGILSIQNGVVTVVAPTNSSTVTLTVSYPSSVSTQVTFYTGYSVSLSTAPSPYPAYPNSSTVELTVLHPVANTGAYQRAQISTILTLATPEESIQRVYDVSGHRSLSYSATPANVASVSPEGVVIPSSSGNVQVSISSPPLTSVENFAIIPSPVLVLSIDRFELTSGDAIVGLVGEVTSASLSVSVTLSDGTQIEDVFTSAGQVYPGLFSVISNDPTLFAVNSSTGQLTIFGSRHTPVSVTITTNQNTNVISQTLPFYINLEPAVGELDLGNPTGPPIPPVASDEEFSVPIRMNINQVIGAFEIGVSYSNNLLELLSVSFSSNFPSEALVESSLREFQGYVYFGGVVNNLALNTGIQELAVLTFRADDRASGVATISGEIISVLDRSQPARDITPRPSPSVNVGVFVGDNIRDTTLPDVGMQRAAALAALAPTATPCSNGVPTDRIETGDLDGDCVFSIGDVLYFQQTGCVPDSDRDFNWDGICDDRDIAFMLQANYRLVHFIQSVSISPVSPADCFLTVTTTLTGRGRPVMNGARTNLLYGLFHREAAFQQQFDVTSVFIGVGGATELSGNQPASTNGGFFSASEVGVNEHQVILNTPISRNNVGLVIIQTRVDSYGTLSTRSTIVHSRYQSIPIQYPEYINVNIVHPTGEEIPFQFQLGFNPLRFFNQTFTSPDCINEEAPRFYPNVTTVEHPEDLRVGSLVAIVFANDTDAGPNANVVYSFYRASAEIHDTFEINNITGEVYLVSPLDREETSVYYIGLQAFDQGIVRPRGGIGELIVRVSDVNDEIPVFIEDPYIPPAVPENVEIDYPVVTVTALDADMGTNSEVTYSLIGYDDVFNINSTSGEIFTIATLDYEIQQQYTLVAVATDGGIPSLSGNTTVVINVDPVNDNAPVCDPTERLALVAESASNGTAFFALNVSDADLGADHGVLSFALAEESREFNVAKVDDTSAVLVTLTDDLDRLVQPLYNVTVLVSDVDGQSCSIFVSIIVVEPVIFDFTIEPPGAGFFSGSVQQLQGQNSFSQEVNFFANSLNSGNITGILSGQSGSVTYTRSPQPPARLYGILHEDEVWPDRPIIAAAVQLRDASLNTIVDNTDVVLQIQPSNPSALMSPIRGEPCERDIGSLSGICAAEIEVPSSWFGVYSSVDVSVVANNVSVSLGEVDLMAITADISGLQENLVIELPSYTLYPDTHFTIWVGASPSIDVKAFQFSLRVPSSVQLGSIIEDEKWGCTQDTSNNNNMASFVCFRALPGDSQASLIGTDRFFGVQASVSEVVTDFTDVTIEVDVTSIASTYGSVISASRPGLIFNRNNITTSPGLLNLEPLEVRGIFASTERPELINTVPLNGEPITASITAYAIYNRVHPRLGATVADSLTCSSSDSNLDTQPDCSIGLTANFTSCTSEIAVEVTHEQSSSTFTLPLRIWCYSGSEIDLSDPILDRVTDWKTDGCSEDRFQRSRFKVMGWFAAGDELSPRVDITDYVAIEVTSSNTSVAVVDVGDRIVSGMAAGVADISIDLLQISTSVVVVENSVDIYSMATTIFTSISLQASPSTYSPASALTVSAVLEDSFDNIGVEGYAAAYVYFTDGALYIIPQSSLRFATNTPDTVSTTSNGMIQSVSSGSAEIEISWIPTECTTQGPLASDLAAFEVTIPVPVDIELTISEETIAGNTLGVPGLGIPTASRVTATLIYSDGTTRTLQAMSEYMIRPSLSLTVTTETSDYIISANPAVNATSGTITAVYVTAGGDEIREDATFTIVSVLSAELGLLAYPDSVSPPAPSILLEILAPGIWQQAQIDARVFLSNGSNRSLIPSSAPQRSGAGSVSISDGGVVSAVTNGGVMLTFTIGEIVLPPVTVSVFGVQTEVQSIRQLTVENISATQKQLVVDLAFADGSVINDIRSYNPALLSLVQFSLSPPGIATLDETTLILNITGNHYNFVNLTSMTTTATNLVSASVLFAANIEPALGEIDLGRPMGIPQPPVSVNDVFSTDIRINIGDSGEIGAFHLITTYDPSDLAALSTTLSLPGLYAINADTTSGVIHTVYLSVFGYELEESEPTIATFDFRAVRNNTLTTITSALPVIVDKSINSIPTRGPSNVDVLIGTVASARRRRDASPRTPRQPTYMLPDFNDDQATDIADAAYLMRYIGSGEGNVDIRDGDANRDGVISVADVVFLARAAAGLVPFIDDVTITPVSSNSDCSLDIQAAFTYSAEQFANTSTSVYFILSHSEFEDEIGISNALIGSQLAVGAEDSVIFQAAPLQEQGAYGLTLNTPLDRQANNVGVSVVVYTEDDDVISSGLDRLAVFTKSQGSNFVSDGSLIPALRNVNLGPDFTNFDILDPNGFSPFTAFTNDERSDYCRFAGRTLAVTLLENIPVGSVVFNFTAIEPPFPSYMENYTIASTTQEGHFTLEADTGVLRLAQLLDFETVPSYFLTIDAYSEQGDYYIGQVMLNITVRDLNDFPPEFIGVETYSLELPENETASTTVPILTVSAVDLDDGLNGQFYFVLEDTSGPFNMSLDGQLYLVGTLDRETVPVYDLTVYVIDMGIPVLNSSAPITINVTDINDNRPIFSEAEYTVSVNENIFISDSVVVPNFTIVATDADAGRNGMVVLSLVSDDSEPNRQFEISNDGILMVISSLDRETRDNYNYTVVAADLGDPGLSNFVELIITIEDTNDHAPVFSPNNDMMVTLEEDTPVNSLITTIMASDRDIGTNAEIVFSILPANAPFSIDSTTGDITVSRPLSVNEEYEYTLMIIASNDLGDVPQSSSFTLKINVIEKQVVTFNVGEKGFLLGEPQRLTEGRRYVQQVGALFGENIGNPVSVSGGINTATSGELDRAEVPNSGDVAVTVKGSVFDTRVRHSLRTVTAFVQAFDARDVIARPTLIQVRVTPSSQLGDGVVSETCTTSEDLGYCIVRVRLPDEWFARDSTIDSIHTISVWTNIANDQSLQSQVIIADNLVVEHLPAHGVSFSVNAILAVGPSHNVYPNQNFSVEVYVVSPLDSSTAYEQVQASIVEGAATLVGIDYDETIWTCGKLDFCVYTWA